MTRDEITLLIDRLDTAAAAYRRVGQSEPLLDEAADALRELTGDRQMMGLKMVIDETVPPGHIVWVNAETEGALRDAREGRTETAESFEELYRKLNK